MQSTRYAKVTVEYEDDGHLYTISGLIKEPVARAVEDENDFDFHYNWTPPTRTKCYLEFEADEDGNFFQIQKRESPAYALGYKRGIEVERQRIKELLDD